MTRATPLPTGDEKVRVVRSMFDRVAPRYDLVNRLMTFGLDRGWRRSTVKAMALPAGSLTLDVACGTGDFCNELLRSGTKTFGFDLSDGMLRAAKTSAPLAQADALRLPIKSGVADGVTCGFALRNVVDIAELFREFSRVLKPGGIAGILEVAQPDSKLLAGLHGIYFNKVVPVIGSLISDGAAYRYLPRSTQYLPPTAQLHQLILDAGFESVHRRLVGLGAAQMILARKAR